MKKLRPIQFVQYYKRRVNKLVREGGTPTELQNMAYQSKTRYVNKI